MRTYLAKMYDPTIPDPYLAVASLLKSTRGWGGSSSTGWNPYMYAGKDVVGFSAVSEGHSMNGEYFVATDGNAFSEFWSSDEIDSNHAFFWMLKAAPPGDAIMRTQGSKLGKYPIRCLQD